MTVPRRSAATLAAHYAGDYSPFRPARGPLARAIAILRRWRASAVLRSSPFHDMLARGPGVMLDVGCGRGDLAAAFARRGWEAHGVEPSPAAAEAAASMNVDVTVGTLQEVPVEGSRYDLVVFNHALEHVPDPIEALTRAAQMLNPTGTVIVAVPDWGSRHRLVFGSRWFHLDLPRHLHHFGRRSLACACAMAGLEPLRLQSSTSLVGLPASIQYATAGRCVMRGRLFRVGLAAAGLLYPVTAAVGAVAGGDCLVLTARRRSSHRTPAS